METVDLLKDYINTPIQSNISKTKYPCTGFCYYVIRNKDKLLELFLTKKKEEYYNFISNLIREAGLRKNENKKISFDGEFINQETIQTDFPDIFQTIIFKEFGIFTEDDMKIFINDFYLDVLDIPIKDCIVVNRSLETFIAIKLEENCFMIIDSHQNKHGLVGSDEFIDYITKFKKYKGNIQLGYSYL
jgi:hypothetical protein